MSHGLQVAGLGADQDAYPPDTQLAAGPTYLLETVNDSGSIWTKGGQLMGLVDLNSFFPVPAGYYFSDPRVLYDSLSGRWFMSGFALDASYDSQVYVAVSTTGDPMGNWQIYTISNPPGIVSDQPKIGISSDKIVISWNDYSSSGTSFTGQVTSILQKSDMLTGGSVASVTYAPDSNRFDIVPAQSLSNTSTEYLVYNNSDALTSSENQGYPTLGVVAITGTPAQGNVAWNESDPAISATELPPDATQPVGPSIATNDDRLLSAVWQNGILWTTANDYCSATGYACLRLIQVSTNAGSPIVLQNFDIGWASGDLFYPAVTLDGNGNAFFSFSAASASLWASAATTAQPADGPSNSDVGLYMLQEGIGSYNDCGNTCTLYNNRWGDYSAAAPDPLDPTNVWVAAEYAASSADVTDWGTGVGEVTLASAPTNTPTPTALPTSTPTPTNTATATPTSTPTPFRVFLPTIFTNSYAQ